MTASSLVDRLRALALHQDLAECAEAADRIEALEAKPKRAYYLTTTEIHRLRSWAYEVRLMFDAMPYMVGSVLERRDYRDVDVRLCADVTPTGIDRHYLNLAVSLWGQHATGLPIDFQAQDLDEFHAHDSRRRDPVGLGPKAHWESRRAHATGGTK